MFAWQVFYAVGFGFYDRLLGGRADNLVVGKNLIYRPKGGWLGRLYLKWLKYAAGRGRKELYLVSSQAYRNYLEEQVGVEGDRVKAMPFGKEDFTQTPEARAPRTENADWPAGGYLLALEPDPGEAEINLINTARGGLVNSRDLIAAIADGKLGGAGLDVLDNEPVQR
ncbi:MAG: hypothetical protein J6Y19_05725, partial [Kiritimatiellae bacterium]|nr:hypothetical protein [Kiritimatiellia bacterium]